MFSASTRCPYGREGKDKGEAMLKIDGVLDDSQRQAIALERLRRVMHLSNLPHPKQVDGSRKFEREGDAEPV